MVSMAKNFSMPCCFMVFALTFVPAFHGGNDDDCNIKKYCPFHKLIFLVLYSLLFTLSLSATTELSQTQPVGHRFSFFTLRSSLSLAKLVFFVKNVKRLQGFNL